MPFNGAGTYNLPAGNPVVSGTTISSTTNNTTMSDVAVALSTTLTRDGQATATADIPMGTHKFTGLSAGTAAGHSLRWEQLFSQGVETALASASTCDIGGVSSTLVNITGTTGISSLGTNYNGPRYLRFSGALTLTHNASTLILPGAANITTAAGDCCIAIPIGNPASGWAIETYQVAALAPGAATSATTAATATKLTTGRTISLTGDATATTGAFDGTANVTAALTIANAAVTLAKLANPFTGPTTSATTSGTSIDMTGIPSWARRVTLAFDAVSTNGTAAMLVQLGSGSPLTTGYNASTQRSTATSVGVDPYSNGFGISVIAASGVHDGLIVFVRAGSSNKWSASGSLTESAYGPSTVQGGVTLGGALDRVRLTTVGGTDAFDAGSISIYWE